MKKAFEFIDKAQSIAIVGHTRPDGDSVGSAVALKLAFSGRGKVIDIYMEGEAPQQFSYLQGVDSIKTALPAPTVKYDLLIIIDLNTEDRMGVLTSLRANSAKVICFDHHLGFALGVDYAVSREGCAATGEIIFDFLKDNKIEFTKEIADALYTAISTDTGCFLYPSTTAHTHLAAAELIKAGCEVERINYINFRVYDKHLVVGLKQVLRSLRYFLGGKICLARLKNGARYDSGQRHKLKQYVSDVKDVRASIFITQEGKNLYYVSLRSHGDVNVEIPAKMFGGGGHKNASGFTYFGRYCKLVKQVVAEVCLIMPTTVV